MNCFDHPDPALAFAEAQGCDVLLTEIELWAERSGGIRLAKRMKEICPCVNIIFVTVYSENEATRELSGLPVSGFMPKPWEPLHLAEVFSKMRYESER